MQPHAPRAAVTRPRVQAPSCPASWCWPAAAAPLPPPWAARAGTHTRTRSTGDVASILTHWRHVGTVQGVLRAGERGDERGAGGDGAAVPGGLVLERGLGRLPGQHRQSVTRSH